MQHGDRGPAARVATALLLAIAATVGAAALPWAPAAASADYAYPNFDVEFDSNVHFSKAGRNYHFEYLDQIPIDYNAQSGEYFGQKTAHYQVATGGASIPAGSCGTFVEHLTGENPQPITVTGFTGYDGTTGSPRIRLSITPPSESYHGQSGCGGADYTQTLWNAAFTDIHQGSINHQNGAYEFTLQRGDAPVVASGTFSGSDNAAGFTDATKITVTSTSPCGVVPQAGTVTISEGGPPAPALGEVVCQGDTLQSAAHGRLEVTLSDGSILRLGPDSKTTVTKSDYSGGSRKVTLKLILGEVWAKIVGKGDYVVTTDRAEAGVRGRRKPGTLGTLRAGTGGGSALAEVPSKGNALYHMISGTGFAQLQGQKAITIAAGEGVEIGANSLRKTTKVPADALALVPASQQPPTIGKLKAAARKGRARLRYRLDRAAKVKVTITKGKRKVASARAKAKAGKNSLKIHKRLKHGRYKVALSASKAGRTSVATGKLRVR